MSKNVKISNGVLEVEISTFGAEIKSVKKSGEEYIWCGDSNVWSGQAPVLFPICGGLRDDKYIYEGKEYTLEKHGFARDSEFEIETVEKDSVVFLLKATAETKKKYPFDFELRITYKIDGNKLGVIYNVSNKGENKMYFSIGAHEAYACPEGIEDYTVIFEKEEDFESSVLDGNLFEHKTEKIAESGKELPLKYKYFAVDAQSFLNIKSRKATLRNNKTGKSAELSFEGLDYFLLWTMPTGKYICMEPWSGFPDFVDSDYDITHKPGISELESGKSCVKEHSIIFE